MITRRGIGGAAIAFGALGAAAARAEGGFAGLPAAFAAIETACGGRLGVAVLDTGSGRRAGHREAERFPMCSTFKLLLAGAVLARIDAERDSSERRVRVSREDLLEYAPVTRDRVGGEGMTLAELCAAILVHSDNTAANLLLGVVEGPEGLTAWLRGLGDGVTRLDRREPELNEARPGDPRDTTSPAAMLADVQALSLGNALLSGSGERLREWMRESRTGDARLRAGVPQSWQVGDRTGTGRNNTSNVVGVLWPPGGAAPLVVTAYLTGGPADGARRDAALAEVGNAVAAAWAA